MKIYPFGLTSYTLRAQSNRGKFTFLGSIVRLLLVLWVAEMIASLPTICLVIGQNFSDIYRMAQDVTFGRLTPDQYEQALQELMLAAFNDPAFGIASLVGLAAVGAGGILYMLAIDRRPLYQTGLLVERGQKRYLPLFVFLGALAGGLVVLVNFLSNAVTFALGTPSLWHLAVAVAELIGSSAYLFFFLAAFLPVVLSHTRGFWRGAIWTAALLGLYLTPATGDTMVSMMNGFLLALILVLLTARTGHIWTAVLSYATLRILCDVVFGDPAFAFLQHAIFDPTFTPGRELTSGGVGGYFSGLGATLVLALALIVVLYLPRRAPREDASSFTQSSL